jgi:hypothetical protein
MAPPSRCDHVDQMAMIGDPGSGFIPEVGHDASPETKEPGAMAGLSEGM